MSLAPGKTLGRYRIESLIGSGGMGEVFLGEDTDLRRKVAIKVLPDKMSSDPTAHKRLLREARAAATLDHPNICSIYEVGERGGHRFIVMQFIEGETLERVLLRRTLGVSEVLQIAVQLADALCEAHAKAIIHRDIKPANVMITPRGEARMMDFGLAKIDERVFANSSEADTATLISTPGMIIGTLPYMSPEQVRGETIDARSDIFGFGTLIYEMITGRQPFNGQNSAATVYAVMTHEPPPMSRYANDVPAELERIVAKALHKAPEDRYQTARDFLIDLRTLRDDISFRHRLDSSSPPQTDGAREAFDDPKLSAPTRKFHLTEAANRADGETRETEAPASQIIVPRRRIFVFAGAIAAVIAVAVGGWWYWQRSNTNWATGQIPRIEEMANAGDYFSAYDLAAEVQKYLPDDPTVTQLMPTISDTISITTEPTGAEVYLKRFAPDQQGNSPQRELIGTTPITNLRIGRGAYIMQSEKEGFVPIERSVLGAMIRNGSLIVKSPPIRIEQKLQPIGSVPEKMVFVPGGDYRLVAWQRPTENRVRLSDFFIDKYEVSNQDFKDFINAGGYLKKQFWSHPFFKDGKEIGWEEAMALFKDRTGLPGPRSWSNQNFPDGRGDHPITDITWYEAKAYAAFRGKTLPTVFQWEKAARNGQMIPFGTFMPWGFFSPGDSMAHRANFENGGTRPVTSAEFGLSPFGSLNMAGNVSEWTLNETSNGFIATGGGWGDPVYTYAQFGAFPGLFSSGKRGFRCALTVEGGGGDQGAAKIERDEEVPEFKRSTEAEFRELSKAYRYEKRQIDPQIVEAIETPEWRREKITFTGVGGERAIAYLYVPKNVARPLQVVHFIPAGDVETGLRPLTASIEDRLAGLIKSGRAVFGVVTQGYIERLRPEGFVRPERHTAEFRELIVSRITDLRIGLDYLETRDDVDVKRLAFFGPSAGSRIGLILAAVEDRYAAIFFQGSGVSSYDLQAIPEANTINFAPHIRGPKMMLQGRYDEDTPLKTHAEPLFKLLSEPKKIEIHDGGHVTPIEVTLPSVTKFLDEHLGAVGNN